MKTPRDILFARHQAVAPRLDAIRREVVGELNNQATKEQSFSASLVASFLCCSNKLWLELFFPSRRIWAGLATVWLFLAVFNVSQRDGSQVQMAKSSTPAAMTMTFRDQQKLLNELFADRSVPAEADRPRIFSPRPRTEIAEMMTV
jgi:hypothetical protein